MIGLKKSKAKVSYAFVAKVTRTTPTTAWVF